MVNATARFIGKARRRVAATLRELCVFPEDEKSILIVFDDDESYYAYVSAYYEEEGDFAGPRPGRPCLRVAAARGVRPVGAAVPSAGGRGRCRHPSTRVVP
ncbi:hypothetical protein M8A51_08445 [Schlegelella sp. S2-27]|uniref:Uncharacterized protein n=1 Tax=Caldimonas mangrovi TaxID=2944811 RepID=A0ABT0YLG6_9BURK|nr:hypothetical protein [Caldimonas mangrovi]MCM5679560.1 hypothetical protein [Caldimonas mangrovi]